MNQIKNIFALSVVLFSHIPLHATVGELIQAIKSADVSAVASAAQTVNPNLPLGVCRETPLMIAVDAVVREGTRNLYSWDSAPAFISGAAIIIGSIFLLSDISRLVADTPSLIGLFKSKDKDRTLAEKLHVVRQYYARPIINTFLRSATVGVIGVALGKKMRAKKVNMLNKRIAVIKQLLAVPGTKLEVTNCKGQTILAMVRDHMIDAMKNNDQFLLDALHGVENLLLEKSSAV